MKTDRGNVGEYPRVSTAGDDRAAIRPFDLHFFQNGIANRDEVYRCLRREVTNQRNRDTADYEKTVEGSLREVRGCCGGTQVLGANVLLRNPARGKSNAGVDRRTRFDLPQRNAPTLEIGQRFYRACREHDQLEAFREQARDRAQLLDRSIGGEDVCSG